jgi:hypothetical protein
MHRLATERRAAGKPIWDRKIRLGDVFHNDAMTFEQIRDTTVKRIRASGWLEGRDEFDDLMLAVEELAEAEDVKHFDMVWSAIYDEADYDRVWIETF